MVYAVIGCGYGDEGKGLVTDYLSSKPGKKLVIRHNGGAQSGHTVEIDDKRFVFHELSSGSFRHADTLWADTFMPDLSSKHSTLRLFDLALSHTALSERHDIYYKRYKVYKQQGSSTAATQDLQDALKSLELDISNRPWFYLLYYTHATWLIEKEEFDRALFENAKAIALWPNFYQYHLQRAEIYARLGQADKARQKLALVEQGRLHRIGECRPFEKAQVYELLGDLDKAEKLFGSEHVHVPTRYDKLYDFYERHGYQDKIITLRQNQRQEPRFHRHQGQHHEEDRRQVHRSGS